MKQPFAACAMQVGEVGTRDDHAMQQLLHVIIRFRLDVGDLPSIPKALRCLEQKRPESHSIPPPQHRTELRGIRRLAWHPCAPGDPGETRTPYLSFRKRTLCPDELR